MLQPDFLPTASLENLRHRAALLSRIRSFFDQRGFFEVETPILSHDICVDRHLHPIAVPRKNVMGQARDGSASEQLWLQTSPEFGMKRLLAAGATAIYQMTKVFRGCERGSRHNPEFSMLEWYQVGDDLWRGMQFLADFIQFVLGSKTIQKISYSELFQHSLGFDPHRIGIHDLARRSGEYVSLEHHRLPEDDRDFYLNLLLSVAIEPTLGFDSPVIVYDWPATQSALAIVRNEPVPVAERFELFVNGIELANGYHELLDAGELRIRNQQQNRLRERAGLPVLPESSRLLAAMDAGIPACAGVAMGLDRLAMLVLGADCIDKVIAFPFSRA